MITPENGAYGPDHIDHINAGPLHNLPEGFPFSADSHIRRLSEPASFALFPYIAGVSVMDDRVAAAVDNHSNFTTQPWGRLLRTVDSATVLVFGSDEETVATAERIYSLHKTIRGTSEGVHYNANDADAQTWVLAAVFNGMAEAKRRWTPAVLTGDEEEGLYQNIKTFGEFFGVDPSIQPSTVDELKTYWNERIDNSGLLKSDVSRRMAQTVFRFSSPKVPRSLEKLGQAISVTSLDSRLQEQADLRPSPSEQKLAAAFDRTMRSTYGRVPSAVREKVIPAYVGTRRQAAIMLGKVSRKHTQKS